MRRFLPILSVFTVLAMAGCEKTIREAKGPANPDHVAIRTLASADSCATQTSP
jgi:hypothetical protein